MRDVFVQTHPGHAHAPKSRVAARECELRPAARLRLLFREISAGLSKLPRPLQKPPLPLLLFFCGRRRVSELIDLLACKVDGLRCGFRASPLHELRSCQPQLDKPTDGLGAVRFIGLPRCPSVHIFTQFGRKPDCRHWVCPVAGRPLFFRTTFCVTPSYFLYYPRRQQRLARKIGDGPAEWQIAVSPESFRDHDGRADHVGGALLTSGAFRHFEPLRMELCREGAHNTRERLLRSRQGPLLGHRGRSVPREEGPLGPRYPRKFVLA